MMRRVFAAIGSDRHLAADDHATTHDARAFLDDAWSVYQSSFDGFTGARLDPQFARLDHPASMYGQPLVEPGTAVVIAGSGPSLADAAPTLRRERKHVSIWTSIRGAEALAAHELQPDLILIQHHTDLDAYLTVRHLRDRNGVNPLASVPVILAEPKTPAQLFAGHTGGRVATFDPAIGWGHWTASLAWLACGSGATSINLAGIDLGNGDQVEAVHAPQASVLSLIAQSTSTPTIDVGTGPLKTGWAKRQLETAPGGNRHVALDERPWMHAEERRTTLRDAWTELGEYLDTAELFHSHALHARQHGDRRQDGLLVYAWEILMQWRDCASTRAAIQEGLGARFLPQFWRMRIDQLSGPAWRPVLLATDEMLRQAQAAQARLDTLVRQ